MTCAMSDEQLDFTVVVEPTGFAEADSAFAEWLSEQGREAEGEPLEFWTHDERQATAAMSRGLTVRGLPDSLPSDAGTDVGISG